MANVMLQESERIVRTLSDAERCAHEAFLEACKLERRYQRDREERVHKRKRDEEGVPAAHCKHQRRFDDDDDDTADQESEAGGAAGAELHDDDDEDESATGSAAAAAAAAVAAADASALPLGHGVVRQVFDRRPGQLVGVWRSLKMCGADKLANFEKVGGAGSLAPAEVVSVDGDGPDKTYTVRICDVAMYAKSVWVPNRRRLIENSTVSGVRHLFTLPVSPHPNEDDTACTAHAYAADVEVSYETARGYNRWIPATIVGRRCLSTRCAGKGKSKTGSCEIPANDQCQHARCVYVLQVDHDKRQRLESAPWLVRRSTVFPVAASPAERAAMRPLRPLVPRRNLLATQP